MAYILASAPSDLQYTATTILVFPFIKRKKTTGLLKSYKMMSLHFVTGNYDSLVLIIQRRWFVGLLVCLFFFKFLDVYEIYSTYYMLNTNRLSQVAVGLQRLHSVYSAEATMRDME